MATSLQDTLDILQTKRTFDVSKDIFELTPDETPFLTFSMLAVRGKPRIVSNPRFDWYEDDIQRFYCPPAATYNDSTTSITVLAAYGPSFRAYDLVKNLETGEIFVVTNVTAGSPNYTLTVVRNFPQCTGSGVACTDATNTLMIIGNLYGEGLACRDGVYTTESQVYNLTEITRTPFGVTRTLMDSAMVAGGDQLTRYMNKKAREHKMERERKMLFGKVSGRDSTNYSTTTPGYPISSMPTRTMGGFFEFVRTNVVTNAAITLAEWDDFLAEYVFQYGSKKKLMIAGSTVLKALHWFYQDKLVMNDKLSKIDMNIKEYVTPFGTLMVSSGERLFSINSGLKGTAIFVDPENIRRVVFNKADTKLVDTTSPGTDGVTKEYITEDSIEIRGEKTHAILQGVTSYS